MDKEALNIMQIGGLQFCKEQLTYHRNMALELPESDIHTGLLRFWGDMIDRITDLHIEIKEHGNY